MYTYGAWTGAEEFEVGAVVLAGGFVEAGCGIQVKTSALYNRNKSSRICVRISTSST